MEQAVAEARQKCVTRAGAVHVPEFPHARDEERAVLVDAEAALAVGFDDHFFEMLLQRPRRVEEIAAAGQLQRLLAVGRVVIGQFKLLPIAFERKVVVPAHVEHENGALGLELPVNVGEAARRHQADCGAVRHVVKRLFGFLVRRHAVFAVGDEAAVVFENHGARDVDGNPVAVIEIHGDHVVLPELLQRKAREQVVAQLGRNLCGHAQPPQIEQRGRQAAAELQRKGIGIDLFPDVRDLRHILIQQVNVREPCPCNKTHVHTPV